MKIKNKLKNLFIFSVMFLVLLALALVFWLIARAMDWDVNAIFTFGAPFLITFLVWFIKLLFNKLDFKRGWKKDLKILMKDEKVEYIRISFAYLYRILINDKYLLIKNARGIGNFQPVGGAYKYSEDEKFFLFTQLNASPDYKKHIQVDETSKNDYRLFVPKEKLIEFVKRFNNTNDREKVDNVTREFYEEMKDFLELESFKTIKYRYCGRHFTKLEWTPHFSCYELLLADIVELIPNDIQEKELLRLQKIKKNKYFYWADKEEIDTLGVKAGTDDLQQTISNHSFKILQTTEKELEKPKEYNMVFEVQINQVNE